MSQREAQNESKREATREKILSAAVALFAERGLAATSAKDIAQKAGVSVGLMYYYYPTKEDAFGALLHEALEIVNEIKSLIEKYSCPVRALAALLDDILLELATSNEFSQWMALLTHPLPKNHEPEWAEDFKNFHSEFTKQIGILIGQGQDSGEFKQGDIMQLAQFLVAALQGLCAMQLIFKEHFVPPNTEILMAYLLKNETKHKEVKI